jgi:hypothetical protein
MNVHSIEPDVGADALLAGAQFIDAYSTRWMTLRSMHGVPPRECYALAAMERSRHRSTG